VRYSKLSSINNSTYTKFLILLFIAICAINILHHEMWRDEVQTLMIVDNSSSLSELINNTKFEWTPQLWYFFIYLIRKMTNNILAIKFFNLIIAITTVYVFLRFSPFTKLQKMLFTFSYFPLYEYGTISRHYILSILLIFTFCALFRSRKKNYIFLSCILFLLCQVNLISSGIAMLLAATVFFDFLLLDTESKKKIIASQKNQLFISPLIFISGLIVIFGYMFPFLPILSDFKFTYSPEQQNSLKPFYHSIISIYRSYIPIPETRIDFWNTNIISNIPIQLVLSLLLWGLSIISLLKKSVPLFLYIFGTIVLTFSFWKLYPVYYLRIEGYLFILLIVCFWISNYDVKRSFSLIPSASKGKITKKIQNVFLTTILFIHFLVGIGASVMDWIYPFSASEKVAKFIKNKKMDKYLIAGDWDFAASTVSFYINKDIYYPRSDKLGSYIIWDKRRLDKRQKTDIDIYRELKGLVIKKRKDLLLVMNYELDEKKIPIKKISEFTKSIVKDEKYYLYIMPK